MKSLLVVPGDSLERCEAALQSGADALVVDLASAALSPEASRLVRMVLDRIRTSASRPGFVVRVGSLSGSIGAELDLAMAAAPEAILLPRVVGGAGVQHLAAKLAVHEAERGFPDGATRIIALAGDTAAGVLALGTVPGSSRRLSGLGWRAAMSCNEAASLNAPDRLARALTLVAAHRGRGRRHRGRLCRPKPRCSRETLRGRAPRRVRGQVRQRCVPSRHHQRRLILERARAVLAAPRTARAQSPPPPILPDDGSGPKSCVELASYGSLDRSTQASKQLNRLMIVVLSSRFGIMPHVITQNRCDRCRQHRQHFFILPCASGTRCDCGCTAGLRAACAITAGRRDYYESRANGHRRRWPTGWMRMRSTISSS